MKLISITEELAEDIEAAQKTMRSIMNEFQHEQFGNNEDRIGSVEFSRNLLQQEHGILGIFDLITQVDWQSTDRVVYTGLSKLFEPALSADEYPMYTIEVSEDRLGNRIYEGVISSAEDLLLQDADDYIQKAYRLRNEARAQGRAIQGFIVGKGIQEMILDQYGDFSSIQGCKCSATSFIGEDYFIDTQNRYRLEVIL